MEISDLYVKKPLSPAHTQFVFGILNSIGDVKNDYDSFMLNMTSALNVLVMFFVADLVKQWIQA